MAFSALRLRLVRPRVLLLLLALGLVLGLTSCGGRASGRASAGARRPEPVPVAAETYLGDCADPRTGGVVGKTPVWQHADRDLNGDDRKEIVVADRTLCTADGNCHWNMYYRADDNRCYRYIGTLSGATIQRLQHRGERGFFSVRTWWHLSGDGRMLLQEYQFRRGGYHLIYALLCRQTDGDRVLCAEEER